MAQLLKADGSHTYVKPSDGRKFTLAELQGFVGGYIELVRIPNGERIVMFINEEGKLKGLPMNVRATQLVQSNLFPGDYIAGDAICCALDEAE